MIPDYQHAAEKAREVFLKYRTNDPLEVIRKQKNTLVLSFLELSDTIGVNRDALLMVCGEDNQDAVTTVHNDNGNIRYLIAFNQRLQEYAIKTALARELGHIALQHDGSRLEEVRNEEALCFAYHFICMKE